MSVYEKEKKTRQTKLYSVPRIFTRVEIKSFDFNGYILIWNK